MNVDWTPQLTARFRHLIAHGVSYAEIAKALSLEFHVRLTKNACVGKGRRLRVPLRKPPRKRLCLKRNAPRNPEQRNPRPSAARSLPRPRKRKLRAHPLRRRKRREPQNRLRDLPLIALLPTSCRWPTGHSAPFTFCGDNKVEGSSYCLKHTLIASPGYGRGR